MKSLPRMALGSALLFTLVAAGPSAAQVAVDLEVVENAFADYCKVLKPLAPAVCRRPGGTPIELKWLHLDLYCSADATPDDCVCDPFERVRDSTAAPVLAFDHQTESWRAYSGIPPLGRVSRGQDLEMDVSGNPTAYLPKGAELLVLIERTNPLLYSVTLGESKEVDVDGLADLQKLAGLFGGVLGAAVRTRAEAGRTLSMPSGLHQLVPSTMITMNVLDGLEKEFREARNLVRKLTKATTSAVATIQENELGRTQPAINCAVDAPPVTEVDGQLTRLRSEIDKISPDCPDHLPAFEQYVNLLEAEPRKQPKLKSRMQALFDSSSCDIKPGSLQVYDGTDTSTLQESVARMSDDTDLQRERTRFLDDAVRQVEFRKNLDELIASAAALVKDWPVTVKTAGQLEVFGRRCSEAIVGASIGTWIIADDRQFAIRWDKMQVHKLKLAVDSPFSASVAAVRPAKLEPTYKVAWRGGPLFDVGFGVTYTSLKAPTYGAVEDPSDSDAKVIAETDEESRAGEFALFLNYRVFQHLWPKTRSWSVHPALDLGAGLDTDAPSFFAGISIGVGRFLRLGAGRTWQQIKVLEGQTLGQSIGSADDIKTRDKFEDETYFMVVFSFGSLKPFSGGGS